MTLSDSLLTMGLVLLAGAWVMSGYLLGQRRWLLGGGMFILCALFIPMFGPLFSDASKFVVTIAAYLFIAGFVASLLRRRAWPLAMAICVTVAFVVSVPHIIGQFRLAGLRALVDETAIIPDRVDFQGLRLVVLGHSDTPRAELVERFGFVSVHIGQVPPGAEESLPDLAALDLLPPLEGTAGLVLMASRVASVTHRYPDLTQVPSEIAGQLDGEAYLFDAATWPAPESLIARQILVADPVPFIGFPFLERFVVIGLDQPWLEVFCAVERRLRAGCAN